jgi:cytochrome c oxidase subunit 2
LIPTPSPARSRARAARLAAVLLPAVVLASGCGVRDTTERVLNVGFPEPVTVQGENIYNLWLGSAAAALVVGVAVWVLIFIAGFKYRKKSEQLPRQVRYNLPIEVLYTGRAVRHHRGALLLHDGLAELRQPAVRRR